MAVEKCSLLLTAGLIRTADSDYTDTVFEDGTRLYRFPDAAELQASLTTLTAGRPTLDREKSQVLLLGVQLTLNLPAIAEEDVMKQVQNQQQSSTTNVPQRNLDRAMSLRSTSCSREHIQGCALVQRLEELEKHLDVHDRRHKLKVYEKCFIGSDAVSIMVNQGLALNRKDAAAKLDEVLAVGLLHHVTRGHTFHDKRLFYRVTAASDIKLTLDRMSAFWLDADQQTVKAKVQHVALVHRYKKAGEAGLHIAEILNSFFGCKDESGWDVVDLQNWRNNMKRWGFGSREDQDHEMVNKLSPLAANIDPDTWEVAGEDWESPNGILAQIAIFDQVSRSAFRGTPEAFRWDKLAIRASKVAIEKGYLHTAYKSTLNQILILLPLQHSESWEDQKLSVKLLLHVLSNAAIEDDGLSDYDIVKRLEFSTRLSTAFLEHAQVVAKFKRFPHRNRAIGRSTTFEERIWLASDLVPRWAKSQNPDETKKKNVMQLPVIPLKFC